MPVDGATEPDPEQAEVYAELLPVFERLSAALHPATVALEGLSGRLPLAF